MNQKRSANVLQPILGTNPRLAWLFFALIAFYLAGPLIPDDAAGTPILDLVFSSMLVFSVYAVSRQHTVLIAAVLLSLPTFAFWWIGWALENSSFILAGLASFAIFFSFITIVLVRNIMKSDEVSLDTIYGAMSAYLLIGVTWSFFYAMIDMHTPGAFELGAFAADYGAEGIHNKLQYFSYYSFVTLSTLGYGDITPLTPFARSLSALQAITGQLFIAVLIARLVGIHIAQKQHR